MQLRAELNYVFHERLHGFDQIYGLDLIHGRDLSHGHGLNHDSYLTPHYELYVCGILALIHGYLI